MKKIFVSTIILFLASWIYAEKDYNVDAKTGQHAGTKGGDNSILPTFSRKQGQRSSARYSSHHRVRQSGTTQQ